MMNNRRYKCGPLIGIDGNWITQYSTLFTFIFTAKFLVITATSSAFPSAARPTFTSPRYNASIVENSVGKTYVVPSAPKMGISHPDDVADISYAIIDGNPASLFKAESRRVGDFCFLRIRTRSGVQAVINREQKDAYRLVVRATVKVRSGPVYTAQAEVFVSVVDANDLSPLFDPSSYDVTVMETAPVHHSVVTVTASDADVGVNAEIFYSFTSPTDMFAVHPTTGVVTVARRLNVSETASYRLTVVARDRGYSQDTGSPRSSTASLTVTVVELNQYSPKVQVQRLSDNEKHGKVGTVHAILYVTDQDHGRNGRIDTVKIIHGDPDRYFNVEKISEEEYRVNASRDLDRERFTNGFNLTIEVKDQGTPARSNSVVCVLYDDAMQNY